MKKTKPAGKRMAAVGRERVVRTEPVVHTVSAPDEPGAPVFSDVFEALANSPEEAVAMRAQNDLMVATVAEVESWKLTQREAARRLGITQPRLNQLLKGKLALFSVDALVELAVRAGLEVRVTVHGRRRM